VPGWRGPSFLLSGVVETVNLEVQKHERRTVESPARRFLRKPDLLGSCEISLVSEPRNEDRRCNLPLRNFVRSPRMDDGDVRDPDKSQDDAEYGPSRL
jgi:hypothetical protein